MNFPLQIRRLACFCLALLVTLNAQASAVEPQLHWSFRRRQQPDVPKIEDSDLARRVRNPIDAFVFQKLRQRKLPPAPAASKHTLVRRAYFDLLGLPPTPEQVSKFVNNESPDAWSNLINELLRSPQYGVRWGRHWLDVARYADSGGYETDIYYRNAWRYRDYVVKSFNDDKPYDQFVQEQIAGDEIWPNNLDLNPKRVYIINKAQRRSLEARIGTGLYTLGTLIHESGLDARKLRNETLTDWADITGSAFLGLTIGCARCHDHKFDPLTQRDYYALQALFVGTKQVELTLLTAMEEADWRQHYPRVVAVVQAKKAYKLFKAKIGGRKMTAAEQAEEGRLLAAIGRAVLALPEKAAGVPNSAYVGIMERPTARVLGYERPQVVKPVRFLDRGELARAGKVVKPAFPVALAKATNFRGKLPGQFGNRKALALWLTRPDHPLTARVMVNRIWHWHFGRGIVATPNDFGAMGQPPSHPRLLDWLTNRFVRDKWSIKSLHRLIMTSSVYQLDSRFGTERHFKLDPKNLLLWRMNRRRLEGEALWDSVHATAQTLNLAIGGPPIVPPLAADEIAALRERWHWPINADSKEHTRRGMYILVRRNFRFPMFEVFDAPVTEVSCPTRSVTTVATQALWNLNSKSVWNQAERLARRVYKQTGKQRDRWPIHIWRIALARDPSLSEVKQALALLKRLQDRARQESKTKAFNGITKAETDALIQLCLAVYNLNEFAFID